MYKYWSRVRVTSWFYEGMEGILIDYMRWRQPNEKYEMVEVSYDMTESDWFIIPLMPEQKKYKIYDAKLNIEIQWPDDWWFLESSLELTK